MRACVNGDSVGAIACRDRRTKQCKQCIHCAYTAHRVLVNAHLHTAVPVD
jgi:hypothetical protein